jgi:DNA modification methylase
MARRQPAQPTLFDRIEHPGAASPRAAVEADGVEVFAFGRAGAPDLLIHGEALDAVTAVDDGALDAIYIDPPFATGAVRHGRGHAYVDRADDPDAFVRWLEPVLAHSRRALTATGSLFVHLDYRAVHYVKVALDRLFGRDQFVNEIVWCYAVGGKSRRGFARKHDTILWYARDAGWAFYPDAVRVPRRGGSHMRVVDAVQEKTDRKTGRVYRYPIAAGKIPEDWWTDVETLNHSARERTGWPSQKPERLVERILRAVTVPGDRIADWFAGSGTTAAVAQRLGRGFITVDREPAAVELCRDRLTRQGCLLGAQGAPPAPLHVHLGGQQSSTTRRISAPALAARHIAGETSGAQGD